MGVCCTYRSTKHANIEIQGLKIPLNSYIINLNSSLQHTSSHTDDSKLLLNFLQSVLNRPKRLKVTIKDGFIEKDDFLCVIDALNNIVHSKLIKDFLILYRRHASYYARESLGFRVCVIESVKYIQSLYIRCPIELYQSVAITPLLYDINFSHYFKHPEVQFAIFSGLYNALGRIKPVPKELRKEVLGDILLDMNQHMEKSLMKNPPADVYDFLVIKAEESDYVMSKYGYDEYEVIAAIWEHNFMNDSYFDDVRYKMASRTKNTLNYVNLEFQGLVPACYYGVFAFSLVNSDILI